MSEGAAAGSRKQGRREPRNLFASLPFVLLTLALFCLVLGLILGLLLGLAL